MQAQLSNLTGNAQEQVKNLNNLLSQTTKLTNSGNISKFSVIGDGKEDLKTITDINLALGRTLKIEQELKENGKIKTVDTTNYDKIYNARLKDTQLRVNQLKQEQKERENASQEYIKIMRKEAEQKLRYYTNSKTMQAKEFDQNTAEYLRGIKLREEAERTAYEERKKRIQQEVKLLQQEQKEREKSQQNSIRLLRLQTEERVKAHLNSVKLQSKELDLQRQLEQFKKQAEINVQRANRKYTGLVNTDELNKYLNESQALVLNPNIKNQMKELTTRLNAITELQQ